MWRDFVQSLTEHAEFAPPATQAEVAEVEAALGVRLSNDLRTLLQEFNGVTVIDAACVLEDGESAHWRVVFSTQGMVEENRYWRTADVDNPHSVVPNLLFFTHEQTGDPVGFPIKEGSADGTQIVTLSHETWEQDVKSASLRDYLTRRLQF